MEHTSDELSTQPLLDTIRQFEEAETFGSRHARPCGRLGGPRAPELAIISGKRIFLTETRNKVLQVLKQADYPSGKYHVVIANPPHMGEKARTRDFRSGRRRTTRTKSPI